MTFFVLGAFFFAPSTFAQPERANAAPVTGSELALFLQLGGGLHRSELRWLRGTTYGLDVQYRFLTHAILEGGCEQYQTEEGTAELQLRAWRTTCGLVLGAGYRSRVSFIGAAGGIDALLSTHVLSFGADTSRSWTVRTLARLEVSALYVSGRYRVGLKARVRLASGYVDARFALSLGYALRSF